MISEGLSAPGAGCGLRLRQVSRLEEGGLPRGRRRWGEADTACQRPGAMRRQSTPSKKKPKALGALG